MLGRISVCVVLVNLSTWRTVLKYKHLLLIVPVHGLYEPGLRSYTCHDRIAANVVVLFDSY